MTPKWATVTASAVQIQRILTLAKSMGVSLSDDDTVRTRNAGTVGSGHGAKYLVEVYLNGGKLGEYYY